MYGRVLAWVPTQRLTLMTPALAQLYVSVPVEDAMPEL